MDECVCPSCGQVCATHLDAVRHSLADNVESD